MRIDELTSIARRLGNQAWVRWWTNFGDRHDNVVMAIQVLDSVPGGGISPIEVRDLHQLGFEMHGDFIYIIPRTNEDGTPFVSRLF